MAKKQQGYVAQKRDNDAGHIYFYNDVEHCEGLIKYHRRKLVKATLVIGDERVFTESEVRAMLMRVDKAGHKPFSAEQVKLLRAEGFEVETDVPFPDPA